MSFHTLNNIPLENRELWLPSGNNMREEKNDTAKGGKNIMHLLQILQIY